MWENWGAAKGRVSPVAEDSDFRLAGCRCWREPWGVRGRRRWSASFHPPDLKEGSGCEVLPQVGRGLR